MVATVALFTAHRSCLHVLTCVASSTASKVLEAVNVAPLKVDSSLIQVHDSTLLTQVHDDSSLLIQVRDDSSLLIQVHDDSTLLIQVHDDSSLSTRSVFDTSCVMTGGAWSPCEHQSQPSKDPPRTPISVVTYGSWLMAHGS